MYDDDTPSIGSYIAALGLSLALVMTLITIYLKRFLDSYR